MAFGRKYTNFFLRLLVYLVIIMWPYTKLQNLYKFVEDFRKVMFSNFAFFKIPFDPKANEDAYLIFFFFSSLAELIFAILGLFDIFIGHVVSMIFFVLMNFIYFNPLMEENRIKLVNTKSELFYNIGLFFALGLLAFYPQPEENKGVEKEIEAPKNLEDDEMKRTMPVKKTKKAK